MRRPLPGAPAIAAISELAPGRYPDQDRNQMQELAVHHQAAGPAVVDEGGQVPRRALRVDHHHHGAEAQRAEQGADELGACPGGAPEHLVARPELRDVAADHFHRAGDVGTEADVLQGRLNFLPLEGDTLVVEIDWPAGVPLSRLEADLSEAGAAAVRAGMGARVDGARVALRRSDFRPRADFYLDLLEEDAETASGLAYVADPPEGAAEGDGGAGRDRARRPYGGADGPLRTTRAPPGDQPRVQRQRRRSPAPPRRPVGHRPGARGRHGAGPGHPFARGEVPGHRL